MALILNTLQIICRLTRDPDVVSFSNGKSLTKVGVALNEKYRDKNGEMAEKTIYAEVEANGKDGEFLAKYGKSGRLTLVKGKLDFTTWKDKEGKDRQRLFIHSENTQFLDKPKTEGASAAESAQENEATV